MRQALLPSFLPLLYAPQSLTISPSTALVQDPFPGGSWRHQDLCTMKKTRLD